MIYVIRFRKDNDEMQTVVIIVLTVLLILAIWKILKYKMGLRLITYYIEKHNIQLDNVEMQKCKNEIVKILTSEILHKKK